MPETIEEKSLRARNLVELFVMRADAHPERGFLWRREASGEWIALSYGEALERVRLLAAFLIQEGVCPKDRVVLAAENRIEWVLADLAIMMVGAWTVPSYATNTEDEHLYILDHSQASVVFTGNPTILKRVIGALGRGDHLPCRLVVAMTTIPDSEASGGKAWRMVAWPDALAGPVSPASRVEIDARVEALARDDLACLIYTSGSSGRPKGVMTTHGAILDNVDSCRHLLLESGIGLQGEIERFLSFLPLSHAYEHTAGLYLPILLGAEIFVNDAMESLFARIAETRPTLMIAVPRLYEAAYQRIQVTLRNAPRLRRLLFAWTLALGRRRLRGERLHAPARALDYLLDRLVRSRIRGHFGGRLKAMVSGGAALSVEISEFFLGVGVPQLQGYGMTEAGPVTHCNRLGAIRPHTVGPPLHGVEQRVLPDGEILIRGPSVMHGYWRDDAASHEALRDGWLHTGDIGVIEDGSYLVIRDRKKDIIVLHGGDNVSPARIEGILALEAEISQAMVIGDGSAHLAALLVPDQAWLDRWAGAQADLAELAKNEDLRASLSEVVARVNQNLSRIEKIRRFVIAPEAFTIENGLLTPSLKLRRKVALGYFAGLFSPQ